MNVRQKTDPGMLPQSQALESAAADTAGVATKRATDARHDLAPGVQHGRGEAAHPQGKAASRGTHTGAPVGGNAYTLVPVLDKHHRPLDPCHPARARELLRKGRAVVHRQVPFVIRLKDRTAEQSIAHPHVVKIDPGSTTTGIAVARETEKVDTDTGVITTTHDAVWLGELVHRGLTIKNNLTSRAALRRGRRNRNLRYRAPRFNNRARKADPRLGVWLAPSVKHRVEGTLTWADRLARWYPVAGAWVEQVRFDTQALENPEITGVQYQQGTLAGYEVREYLLEKFGRTCAYCDASGVPVNIDHVHPKSKGGSNRVSNLTLACIPCNQAKSNQPVEEFLAHDPARLARIMRKLKAPLRDAAAVNTTRKAIVHALEHIGIPVTTGTGGRTKFNRNLFGVPKTHALDALCVGPVDWLTGINLQPLGITATGRGSYARTRSNKYGFPRLRLTRTKQHFGFATGDLVRAVVPAGRKAGTHVGRVAVRATGSFNITTPCGTVQGIHHRHVRLIQRADGYRHTRKEAPGFLPALTDGVSAGK